MNLLNLVQKHFPEIGERDLQQAIVSEGRVMHFKGGTVIQSFGDYIKMIPLVVEGSIKVLRENPELSGGNELFLYYINPGETCTMAFSCCMRNKKSEIKTIAEIDTVVIGIPIHFMDAWMSKYQTWKNFVMTAYDKRMIGLIEAIDNIAFTKMDERLITYLKNRAKTLDSSTIITTHQIIATDLNASREAISRLLKSLERKGIIKLSRNKIQLL